jgi:hypothetical protein
MRSLRDPSVRPSNVFARRSTVLCPAADHGGRQSTVGLASTARRSSVLITITTAGHRITTDHRHTTTDRRRRCPCLITCFSSPERVPIFGIAGLNRCQGRPIEVSYPIGLIRVAMGPGRTRVAIRLGMTRVITSMTHVVTSTTLVVTSMIPVVTSTTRVVNCLIATNSKR